MTQKDPFAELLRKRPPLQSARDLLRPLRQLAASLRNEGIGAEVTRSKDGWRHHLAVYPKYRPGLRSLILTIHVANDGGTVLGPMPFTFGTPAELMQWLQGFVTLPTFRATLENLRELAKEDVEVRLEREDGMAHLGIISPAEQEKLATTDPSKDVVVDLVLPNVQQLTGPSDLKRLNAAGLRFDIISVNPGEFKAGDLEVGLQVRSSRKGSPT